MPIGSRKSNAGEYVFVDGKAMRAGEAGFGVPGAQAGDSAVPGADAAQAGGRGRARASAAGGRAADAQGARWSARRALQDLESSPAFEQADDFQVTLDQALSLRADDRRQIRRVALVLGGMLLALTLFSLCIGVNVVPSFHDPASVVAALGERVRLAFGKLLGLSFYTPLSEVEANQAIPGYADICERFDVTLVTLICGFLMSLSGMMYQNVFRNPIAAPSMLGVSAGVRIGTIILVLVFGEAALTMQGMRYAFCYAGGVIIILGVMGFSKLLAGKGRPINVVDMLIAGSIFSQFLSIISQYFLTYIMDDTLYEVFYELTSGMRTSTEWYSFIFLIAIIVISVMPVIFMRFRLNTVAFDDADARMMGVDPERMRVFVLIMGTLMILAAQIHVGIISLVALVVPFLTRYVVGSEFGKQLLGNMLMGPLLLLVCRDICSLVPFVGEGLSLQMVVGFVALPVYVWMMALGKRGWE